MGEAAGAAFPPVLNTKESKVMLLHLSPPEADQPSVPLERSFALEKVASSRFADISLTPNICTQ